MKPLALTALFLALIVTGTAHAGGVIHGTIATRDGETYTGTIRWDKNEVFWNDFLDTTKDDEVEIRDRDGINIRIFGFEIVRASHNDSHTVSSQFTIPFGHLESIRPTDSKRVQLRLKNGYEITVKEGADLGSNVRGIVVTADNGRETELDWDDVALVTFSEGETAELAATRLYGVVESRVGDFTGFVTWDVDEALGSDILDGDADGRRHKIPFSDIASVERAGKSAALVTLHDGEELRLSGSNDVNNDNRGITVQVRDMGAVKIDWEDVRLVTFQASPASPAYDAFTGGTPLHGTLTTDDGESMTGEIVWDRDEIMSWEALDGDISDVKVEVLFQYIDTIERASSRSAKVTLKDGLELTLRGSNDVDRDNKGILVREESGRETEIFWDRFASVRFHD